LLNNITIDIDMHSPTKHRHMYLPIWFRHVPSLRQGWSAHSSMSISHLPPV